MKIIITAVNNIEIPYLPDGGRVSAGATKSFDLQHNKTWDDVKVKLDELVTDGDCSYELAPSDAYPGPDGLIYKRSIEIGFADFAEESSLTADVVDADGALPDGALLMGYRKTLTAVFNDGDTAVIDSAVIDAGFDTDGGDVLDDGQDIFTGATLGTSFGAGTNALPNARRDVGGQTFQATITVTSANLNTLAAGAVLVEMFYTLPPAV
ncbi:MAG: hypothetical protein KKH12_16015 [Gammaproteobacteria bacterium]|nr:hypothetical protein [Gammaproteobacteria bacterium]